MIASRLTTPSAACVCSMVGKAEREREKCETKEVKKEGERREEVTKEGKRRKRRAAISRRKDRTTDRPTDRQTSFPGWISLTQWRVWRLTRSVPETKFDKVRRPPSVSKRRSIFSPLKIHFFRRPNRTRTQCRSDTVTL